MKNNSLLNRTRLREALLDEAKRTRHQPFARVSGETFDKFEGLVRAAIKAHVRSVPSKGVTL